MTAPLAAGTRVATMLVSEHDAAEAARAAASLLPRSGDSVRIPLAVMERIAVLAGHRIPLADWDEAQRIYRAWLVFDEPKSADCAS